MRQLLLLFMILLVAFLATSLCVQSQTIPLQGVTTNITPTTSSYVYRWEFETAVLERGLSHVEVFFCPDAQATNAMSNVRFKLESREGRLKFDGISTDEPTVWFEFESIFAPEAGTLLAKAGPTFYEASVLTPGCSTIPEPNTLLFAPLASLLALHRHRHILTCHRPLRRSP